jgi:hypothetical protein
LQVEVVIRVLGEEMKHKESSIAALESAIASLKKEVIAAAEHESDVIGAASGIIQLYERLTLRVHTLPSFFKLIASLT